MATYKNNHKKKGNEKFVSYVIIGFAVAFFAVLISLLVYNSLNNEFENSPLLDMPEEQYLVYLFSDNCSHCILIKDEVAAFSNDNAAGIKLYYLNAKDLKNGEFEYLNKKYDVNGTPSMFTVVDGKVVDVSIGSSAIPSTFNAINSGTYAQIK